MVLDVKKELENVSWVEKYRPKTVKDVVSVHTEKILNYLKTPNTIPNFLFYSRIGGTGKTSVGKAIIKDLGCDVLFLNASVDRSIEIIRNKVKNFLLGQSSNGVKRCVMMDESEKLSHDAMDSLKNMIEEYHNNAFFIFTTNNVEKINQPMQSRFRRYDFSSPDKKSIKNFLVNICDNEKMLYTDDGLDKLIDLYYPSIRDMIGILQDLFTTGLSVEKDNVVNPEDKYKKMFGLIKEKKYNSLKKVILEDSVDVVMFNKFIFNYCMRGGVNDLKTELNIVQCCARNVKSFNLGADPTIIFLAEVVNMIKSFT